MMPRIMHRQVSVPIRLCILPMIFALSFGFLPFFKKKNRVFLKQSKDARLVLHFFLGHLKTCFPY